MSHGWGRILVMAAAAAVGGAVVAGSQAMAQAPPYHVSVSGAEDAAQLRDAREARVGAVTMLRDGLWGGKDTTTDARVSGRFTSLLNQDEYRGGRVDFWVPRHTLKNAKGSWLGTGFGFRDAAGSHYLLATDVGAGAYRGLVYRLVVLDYRSGTAAEHTFELLGWIEKGTAKPVPTVDGGHVKIVGREVTTLEEPGVASEATGAPGDVRFGDGATWAGTSTASDRRLRGTLRLVLDEMTYEGRRQDAWGTYALSNAEGAWKGEIRGVRTPDGRYVRFVVASGSGAYRGLRYRAVLRSSGRIGATTRSWGVNGWIEPVR